jgi:hypothetical protein
VVKANSAMVKVEPVKPVLQVVEDKGTALSAPEIDSAWKARIEYFRTQEDDTLHRVLRMYWERGQFAAELFNNPKHWGGRTAENMAKDLSNDRRKIHPDEVRQWHRFFSRYTEEELNQAVKLGVTWHAVQVLLSVDDKGKRALLQENIAKGKIKGDKILRAAVKDINKSEKKAGRKKEGRGGLSITTVFKNVASMALEFQKRLDEYRDALKQMEGDKEMDEETAKRLTALRKEARKALSVIARKLEGILSFESEA